jgi:hypothetical protein
VNAHLRILLVLVVGRICGARRDPLGTTRKMAEDDDEKDSEMTPDTAA